MKLNLIVQSHEEDWLKTLYNNAKPSRNDKIKLSENINLEYKSTSSNSMGFVNAEFVVSLVIDIGVGVTIEVLSRIIYEKLMNFGKNRLVIREEQLIIITKDELMVYIKRITEK